MSNTFTPDYFAAFFSKSSASQQLDPENQKLMRRASEQKQKERATLEDRGITSEMLQNLYSPDMPHNKIAESEAFGDEYPFKVKRISLSNVIVRYLDEDHSIHMTIEGEMDAGLIDQLVMDLKMKLEAIQGSECEVRSIPFS